LPGNGGDSNGKFVHVLHPARKRAAASPGQPGPAAAKRITVRQLRYTGKP
jgi:hypothetical protein